MEMSLGLRKGQKRAPDSTSRAEYELDFIALCLLAYLSQEYQYR